MIFMLVNSGGIVSPANPTGSWVFSTDYASLKLAAATGKHVWVPPNTTHTVTPALTGVPNAVRGDLGEILLAPNQMLVGADKYTSKIVLTNGGGLIELDNFSQVHNLTFEGPGKSSGLIFSRAITTWSTGFNITNCIFKNFAGATGGGGYGGGAIMCYGKGATTTPYYDYKDGATISDNWFDNNFVSLNIVQRAEFLNVTNSTFINSDTAIANQGGNNKFSNLNIVKNNVGFKLYEGTNSGHGSMTNCMVNHNVTALDIDNQYYGFSFSGCHFHEGHIKITSSTPLTTQDITFSNCQMIGYNISDLILTDNAANGVRIDALSAFRPTTYSKALIGNDLVIV